MATTGSDAPLPPAEAVAVFDRFKANVARVAAVRPADVREVAEREEPTATPESAKPQP